MEPVRWGIAGFGWVARDFMAPAISDAGDRLVAVADLDASAREAARTLGASVTASLDELVSHPEVEAVYVATPNHLHRLAVEAAARAGKAVLCEKPMASTLTDAEAMASVCREAGVLYGTAFDQRHHPAHRALRAALRAGVVGTVTAVRIVYACWLGPDWTAGFDAENWRIDGAKAGGGALMDLAPHGLDLVEFLLDEPIDTVKALLQNRIHGYAVDDGAVVIARTRSGVLASLDGRLQLPRSAAAPPPRRRWDGRHDRGVRHDGPGCRRHTDVRRWPLRAERTPSGTGGGPPPRSSSRFAASARRSGPGFRASFRRTGTSTRCA